MSFYPLRGIKLTTHSSCFNLLSYNTHIIISQITISILYTRSDPQIYHHSMYQYFISIQIHIIIGGFNIQSNMRITRTDTNNIKLFPFILYITNTSFPYNPIQTSITSYTSLNTQQWKRGWTRGWKRQWTREGIIILPDTISIHNYNTTPHNSNIIQLPTFHIYPSSFIQHQTTSSTLLKSQQQPLTILTTTKHTLSIHILSTHIQIHSIQLSIHHSILSNPHQHTIHSIQSTTINNQSIIITTHQTYSIHNQTHTLSFSHPISTLFNSIQINHNSIFILQFHLNNNHSIHSNQYFHILFTYTNTLNTSLYQHQYYHHHNNSIHYTFIKHSYYTSNYHPYSYHYTHTILHFHYNPQSSSPY